jgi:hypothetical protein
MCAGSHIEPADLGRARSARKYYVRGKNTVKRTEGEEHAVSRVVEHCRVE